MARARKVTIAQRRARIDEHTKAADWYELLLAHRAILAPGDCPGDQWAFDVILQSQAAARVFGLTDEQAVACAFDRECSPEWLAGRCPTSGAAARAAAADVMTALEERYGAGVVDDFIEHPCDWQGSLAAHRKALAYEKRRIRAQLRAG